MIEIAGSPVMVRANRRSAVDAIGRRLERWGPVRRADDADGPGSVADISLVVADHEDGRRTVSSVHRLGNVTRTTFDLEVALDTVDALLHTFGPAPAGAHPMHARALERDGGVLLVSDTFRNVVDGHHRRLNAAGYRTWAHSPVLVDPRRGEALLPIGAPGASAFRRLPITGVVMFAPAEDVDSPAVRTTHFTALVTGRGLPTTGAGVQALVDLMERVPFVRVDDTRPGPVSRRLVELAADD